MLVAASAGWLGNHRAEADPADERFFEQRIRPLLAENCFNCHSAQTNSKGGLRVDDRQGLLTGDQSGAAIVPGQPDESLLIRAVSHSSEDLKMPPNKQLEPEQIVDLKTWIAGGAPWPAAKLPDGFGQLDAQMQKLKSEHWAWQPRQAKPVPKVRQDTWPADHVDQFVLTKWEENRWTPLPDASADNLIRRIYYDLVGLPPLPEDVQTYVASPTPQRLAELVDKLLSSTAFGEKWGRHWLDIARYAESTGPSRNIPYPHAWRYRDYVIKSFNSDKPFDQFVREQIAGDLLPAATDEQREEQTVATGFLAIGMKDVNQRFRVRFIMDNVDEQIDTVSRSLLALTVSCARCHDHKFDPITSREYYALAGIFTSTDLCAGVRSKMGGGGLDYYAPENLIVLGPDADAQQPDQAKVEELRQQVTQARSEFQALKGKPEGNEPNEDGTLKRVAARQKWNKLQQDLIALTDPAQHGIAIMGVRDGAKPADTEIRVRGEAEKLGPIAARGFLEILGASAPAINPNQSGRLELAQWLTNPSNPLTARVIVNRVWKHVFGEGLVRTVDNFGVTGQPATHPELLDYLAEQFIEDGWSIKRLVRRLVLTRLYRLDSNNSDPQFAVDPDNRLLWRHATRRLTAEELRDTILYTAGDLDSQPVQKSAAANLRVIEISNNGTEAKRIAQVALESRHRSIYLPLLRDLVPMALTVFDFADQSFVVGDRDDTNVPSQSLFFLNSKFVLRESLSLAEKLQSQESDDTARLKRAYRLVLGRDASESDVAQGLAFLNEYAELARSARSASTATVASAAPTTPPNEEPASATSGAVPKEAPEKVPAGAPANLDRRKGNAKIANPDDPDGADQIFEEPFVFPSDTKTLAWMTLCQSLYASAEFRYLR
jgi:cytochrome c553